MKKLFPILFFTLLFAACSDEDTLLNGEEAPKPALTGEAVPPEAAMTRAEVAAQFMRGHAVGYSYNAVSGKYCNMADVRCQILNRAVVDKINANEQTCLSVDYDNQTHYRSEVYTSLIDYVQTTSGQIAGGAEMFLFSGGVSSTFNIFEQGISQQYILRSSVEENTVTMRMNSEVLRDYIDDYPEVLCASFRAAVQQLADLNSRGKLTDKVIDDFIDLYGTHVICECSLGGRLSLDVQVEKRDYINEVTDEYVAEVALALFFKKKTTSTQETKAWETVKNSKVHLSVKGGDLTTLNNVLDVARFNAEGPTEDMLLSWIESVDFDYDEPEKNTVELTYMDVEPIWNYILDEEVAMHIRRRAVSSAEDAQKLYGNRNFISTSFAYPSPTTMQAYLGGQLTKNISSDAVVVIAAGRPVATLCRELVPALNKKDKVIVAYPIYEGTVNLAEGLCVYNGKVYDVEWRYNKFTVAERYNEVPETTVSKLYLNAGRLSTLAVMGVQHQQSNTYPDVELPSGVLVDGDIDASKAKVAYKHFGHFYLRSLSGAEERSSITALPGWNYKTSAPEEQKNYSDYIKSSDYSNRMVRDENYIYRYNPTELDYKP